MISSWLFPHTFKKWGWLILIISLILGILYSADILSFDFLTVDISEILFILSDEFADNNMTDELAGIGIIIGLILVGFSKLKIEDEYSQKIRLDSLLWATYINYGLIILAIIFVYGSYFLSVMIYNLFTMLVIFIVRFHIYLLRR